MCVFKGISSLYAGFFFCFVFLRPNPLRFNSSIKSNTFLFEWNSLNTIISDAAKFVMFAGYSMIDLFSLTKQKLYICPSPKLVGCKQEIFAFTLVQWFGLENESYEICKFVYVCVLGGSLRIVTTDDHEKRNTWWYIINCLIWNLICALTLWTLPSYPICKFLIIQFCVVFDHKRESEKKNASQTVT